MTEEKRKNQKMTKIAYPFTISFLDYPDNESTAIMVYFLGCDHNCPQCQNTDLRDEKYTQYEEFSIKEFIKELEIFSNRCHTNKIVLTGGDPLSTQNILFTKDVLEYLGDKYDFCIYTGYEVDYIKSKNISHFKYLKCGKYIENLKQNSDKTDSHMKLASKNQKLFDIHFNQLTNNGLFSFTTER